MSPRHGQSSLDQVDGHPAWKLAMVQMTVSGADPGSNLARAADRIAEAAAQGAQVALLPEALDLGWTHPLAKVHAEPIPDGKAFHALAESASRHGIHVCAGLTERSGDRVYNAAVLLDSQGRLLLHHRKLNELEIGHAYYDQGDRLGVVDTALGTLGLMICADAFARGQVVSRTLGLMGAQVILSPCAWAVPADHDNRSDPYGKLWKDCYGPVARGFRLWIAGVSNVGVLEAGPWEGRRCIGCSLLTGPDGATVVQGPYGADADITLLVDIQPLPRPTRGDGWSSLQ
jgi:predicted amidohydrolase